MPPTQYKFLASNMIFILFFLNKSGITFSLKRTTQKQMVILYQKTGFKCLYYDSLTQRNHLILSTHLLTLPHQIRF